jgi:hypothetical protein
MQRVARGGMLCTHLDGFDLHGRVAFGAAQRDRIEELVRYCARPPLAHDRLEKRPDGRYLLRLKTRFRDGTTHLLLEPIELMERLAAQIPKPRVNLVLYSGVLAPNARLRAEVVRHARPAPMREPPATETQTRAERENVVRADARDVRPGRSGARALRRTYEAPWHRPRSARRPAHPGARGVARPCSAGAARARSTAALGSGGRPELKALRQGVRARVGARVRRLARIVSSRLPRCMLAESRSAFVGPAVRPGGRSGVDFADLAIMTRSTFSVCAG